MIVATPEVGRRLYSNDGQVFRDGDVTIYAQSYLPEGAALTSTALAVTFVASAGNISVCVSDVDSGYVFWKEDGLSVSEAAALTAESIARFSEYH